MIYSSIVSSPYETTSTQSASPVLNIMLTR